MASTSPPSEDDIIALAKQCRYEQYRPMESATLYFIDTNGNDAAADSEDGIKLHRPSVKIHVYYTTRGIMTQLGHPVQGTNQMWRSNAYSTLDELKQFFLYPRKHTGKGYRTADNALRGCTNCGELQSRKKYSHNQWRKGPDKNRCEDCVQQRTTNSVDVVEDITDRLTHIGISTGDGQQLTSDALIRHDKAQSKKQKKHTNKKIRNNDMERRQFNCPECPKHGRHPNVFYKKVPKYKPIVKCTVCKKVNANKNNSCVRRLLAIPRGQERGYGFYKCSSNLCGRRTWGSSRALYGVGQECQQCKELGTPDVMVVPFRMEIPKGNSSNKNRRDKPMVRVPRNPIQEEEPIAASYTDSDQRRFQSGASNALVPEADYESRSYDFRETSRNVGNEERNNLLGGPKQYQHKCTKCGTGECRNRKVPKSKIHDVSDGDTVSTRSSIVTNSTIDRSDYIDRDEDFSAFEVDWNNDDDDDNDDDIYDNDNGHGNWVEV